MTRDDLGRKDREFAEPLWRAQRSQCCCCEQKILLSHNDLEHYRPAISADRSPGSAETHGYWWLAFTWKNLLFACAVCNRSRKNDRFPLDLGSRALRPREAPPGQETPLLLDPAFDNAVEHIEFVFSTIAGPLSVAGGHPRKQWWPRARHGSKRGDWTIRVCGLAKSDLAELYDVHVNREVRPRADALERALLEGTDVTGPFENALALLHPAMPFVGLSYDALCSLVPPAKLAARKLAWPEPKDVGVRHGSRKRTRRARAASVKK